jgi:hypothetical protein
MKHKYPIGTWVRFYNQGLLTIAEIRYLSEQRPGDFGPIYNTDKGSVAELNILEARLPFDLTRQSPAEELKQLEKKLNLA